MQKFLFGGGQCPRALCRYVPESHVALFWCSSSSVVRLTRSNMFKAFQLFPCSFTNSRGSIILIITNLFTGGKKRSSK